MRKALETEQSERLRHVVLVLMKARYRGKRPVKIGDFVREASRNLGAFGSAYAWLFADLVAFSRRRVIAVVALNLLGVILQWAVVGAVLVFVGELTGEGGAFQVPLLSGVDLPVKASFTVLSLWGASVLLLVAAASVSAYGAEAIGFETARRYVDSGSRGILLRTLTARSRVATAGESPARQLRLVLLRDQLLVQRALLVIQRSLRAVLMVLVAGIVLVLINPVLSAVVAFVATLFVVPYYLVNQRMVGAAATLHERSASAGATVMRLVEHATSRDPNAEILRVVPELYLTDRTIADRWNGLRDIMLGGQRTSALMTGVVGTCLVAVVFAFGVIIARDETSWVAALTFVIGLNFASGAFMQLAGLVTAANRFLPQVQNYVAYVRELSPTAFYGDNDKRLNSKPPTLPAIRAPNPLLTGSAKELPLTAGIRALCFWPAVSIDRLNVHLLLRRLVAGSEKEARHLREAAFFYGDPASLPPVSVRSLLGRLGPRALQELGLAEEVSELPEGEATILTPRTQERLSPLLRYALGMVEGLDSELLVLDWTSFSRLGSEQRARILEIVEPRPVLFVTAATPGKQPAETTHTVVITEDGIAGMGDARWYKKVVPGLKTQDLRQPPVEGGAGLALDELADA